MAAGESSLFQAIVASSEAPLLLLDGELKIVTASVSFCRSFQIDPRTVEGCSIFHLADSLFYNLTTAVAMLAGRFGLAALALTLAGRFAAQPRSAESPGTLPSDTVQFGILVLSTILIVGGLNFMPALALGPILEALGGT
jgi:K+-transporting ATPase ATPase A chain